MQSDALIRKVATYVRRSWEAAGVKNSSEDAPYGWAYGALNACEQAGLVVFDPATITAREKIAEALDTHHYAAPGVCKCGYVSKSWEDSKNHRVDMILEALSA